MYILIGKTVSVKEKEMTLDELIKKYEKLLSNLKNIFTRIKYPVQKMISIICFDDKQNLSRFHDPVICKIVKSIEDLFHWISLYLKFYDYSILQTVVSISQCDEAVLLMDEYVTEIEDTLIHDLDLKSGSQMEEYKINGDTSKVEVTCEIKKLSVKEYNYFIKTLTRWLNLPPGSVMLKEITQDSEDYIIFTYEISSKVKDYLMDFTFTTCELKPLAAVEIASVIMDDKVELKVSSGWDTEVTLYTCLFVTKQYVYVQESYFGYTLYCL